MAANEIQSSSARWCSVHPCGYVTCKRGSGSSSCNSMRCKQASACCLSFSSCGRLTEYGPETTPISHCCARAQAFRTEFQLMVSIWTPKQLLSLEQTKHGLHVAISAQDAEEASAKLRDVKQAQGQLPLPSMRTSAHCSIYCGTRRRQILRGSLPKQLQCLQNAKAQRTRKPGA